MAKLLNLKTNNSIERFSDEVRADSIKDRTYIVTKSYYISPNVELKRGEKIRYDGRSAVYRPKPNRSIYDVEVKNTITIEYGIRIGWLKLEDETFVTKANKYAKTTYSFCKLVIETARKHFIK